MYHVRLIDSAMHPNGSLRLPEKASDLQELAVFMRLSPADTESWLACDGVQPFFDELAEDLLRFDPVYGPRTLPELCTRLQATEGSGDRRVRDRYVMKRPDKARWDVTDHCLRFIVQVFLHAARAARRGTGDSIHFVRRDVEGQHTVILQPTLAECYSALLFLAKWHMADRENQRWLEAGGGDFYPSPLWVWYEWDVDEE